MKKSEYSGLDREIREMFHKELPEAPENPWFVKKILNRLPEPMAWTPMSVCVNLFYILGALAMVSGWIYAVTDTINNGLSSTTLMLAIALPVTTLVGIGLVAIPAIKRSL